ncbi:hypothetical protein COU54_03655 [Candidatus Pacearchaeota archaeon CG10_big_fil_rev_8_21_14_0_10_31_24]|nr:MAG: hypothetical protein COU54_03655 [Candidatus Pacearchaeota archaeon CG10_big_fil_rev_8_21_14_0_10_31_24]
MEFDIEVFKSEYEKKAKKYGLPSYESLLEEFDFEKVNYGSEVVVRVSRRYMLDKVHHALNFLEMLLNPVNLPRIYMPFVKSANSEDKKNMDKLYSDFGKLSLKGVSFEAGSSEKEEAELVKEIYKVWKQDQSMLKEVLNKVDSPNEDLSNKDKSYFG